MLDVSKMKIGQFFKMYVSFLALVLFGYISLVYLFLFNDGEVESSEKMVFDHSISFEVAVGEKFPVDTLTLDVNDYVFQGYLDDKVVIAERGNRGRSESLYFSLKEKDVITLSGYVLDSESYDIEVVRLDEDSNKIELKMSKYVAGND